MQFFWKHLHNNKGDENVSKLIWIVIAFVIGALLLSTMSVAFRTDGTGTISGWLNSSLENWFGEADGRDGSVNSGTGGSGGGLPGGGPNEGGSNEATSLEGIVMSYDATIGALTSDNDKNNGNKYTTLFTEMSGTVYETSVYYSPNGATTSGNNLLLPEATVIDVNSVPEHKEMFANGTKVIVAKDNDNNTFYIGVDNEGNVICPMPSNPANDGEYVIFSAEDNSPIVLTWNNANSTLMSSGKDYTDMFTGLTEGLSYAVAAYPSAPNGSNVDETDSVLGVEYAVAKPAPADSEYKTGTMILEASNGVTTGVDASGNILVLKAAKPSTGNAVYSQGTEGFENVEPEEDQTIHNSTTIPEGATYYVGVTSNITGKYTGGEKLEAGNDFPQTPTNGDVYVYGDYEYRYKKQALSTGDWANSGPHWGVDVLDETKTEYGPILASINKQPITGLDYTFYNCSSFTKAPVIPDSVKYMKATFQNCTLLTKAPAIPVGVTDISNTFYKCSALTKALGIPSGITKMERTFYSCTSLTEVPAIPDTVTNMSETFYGCSSLTEAPSIPNGVTNMFSTFGGCTLLTKAPLIPNSVTNMKSTFYNCSSLIKVSEIPNSVTNMDSTFSGCTSLTEVLAISDNITSMYCTFYNCTSLAKAPEIPAGVTNMNCTFYGCSSLTEAPSIPNGVTNMSSTFSDCTLLTKAPLIPDSVTNMKSTFYKCLSLAGTIKINSKNVTSANYIFDTGMLGRYLTVTVQVPAGSTTYTTLSNLYNGTTVTIQTF